MKANVLDQFGDAENFIWREMPTPQPGPNEVLLRVTASGVNLGDTLIRSGKAGWQLPLPLILGSEAVGVVEALGNQVHEFAIGQRVLAAPFATGGLGGGYATHICLPASAVFALAAGVSDETAVALGVAGITALELTHKVPLEGRAVLVHAAAGGVGNILLQLVRASGASTVLAVVGDQGKAAGIDGLGADHVLDSRGDWASEAVTLTDGRGPDVIFDAVGGELSRAGLAVLAQLGHFVAYGGASGTYPAISTSDMPAFVMKCQMLVGFSIMPMLMSGTAREVIELGFANLHARVLDGTLRPLIGARFPLDQVADAHRLIESRQSVGKIILVP